MLQLGKAGALTLALLGTTSALAQSARTVLPHPAPAFSGTIGETIPQSRPGTPNPVRAPQGAPNILVLMSDDVGFAMASTEQADAFHAAGVANGGTTCENPPGWREGPSGPLYLAYLRDPDGNKICALYRKPKV